MPQTRKERPWEGGLLLGEAARAPLAGRLPSANWAHLWLSWPGPSFLMTAAATFLSWELQWHRWEFGDLPVAEFRKLSMLER